MALQRQILEAYYQGVVRGLQSSHEEVTNSMNIRSLVNVASLVAFGAGVFGSVLFGHAGLELVSAGLFLHVGADLIEDVLS